MYGCFNYFCKNKENIRIINRTEEKLIKIIKNILI